MERVAYIVPLVAYGLVAVVHLLPSLMETSAVGRWLRGQARLIATVGAGVHLATLVAGIAFGEWRPGFPEALAAASFGVIIAYAIVATGRARALGALLAPLAIVILGTALVVPHKEVSALAEASASPWLPIHLGLIFAGFGGFTLSFVVGALYLFVRSRLKRKKIAGLHRWPSLEVLDRIQFRSTLFGFVFLTLGIGAGGILAAASLAEPWTLDPKVLTTVSIWVWYAIALQFRLVGGWRGRRAAMFSVVGFGGLVFSLVAMNFLVQGWHAYVG